MSFFGDITDSLRILPRAFGLDISDSGLKFVYLKNHQDEYEVQSFGERSFAKGIVEKGKVLDAQKLAQEIDQTIRQERKNDLPPYAVIGFPEEDVFIRVVQMPKMTKQDLVQGIQWEIEGNIPLSIENVYYTYQEIGSPVAGLDHMDVLVAAAPKEVVDGYVKTCALAGIQPLAIEPASVALARALILQSDDADDIVLVDMGAMHTRIAIYAKGALRLTSSIPVILEDAIANIMREFSYDHSQAERMLYANGLSKGVEGGRLFGAVIPTLTDLKEQTEKYMEFQKTHREHEHSKEQASFSSIIIAGGGALIPGITDYFSEAFGVPTQLADPWINLPIHHKGEIPNIPYRDALRFASSVGLALRGALPPKSLDENNFFAV